MRLTTIWTLRGMSPSERIYRTADRVAMRIAALLPKLIAYWSFILVGDAAIKPAEVVPEVAYMDLLERVPGGPR